MKTTMERAEKVSLGGQKKKTKSRNLSRRMKKRGLLKRIVKYLKSDTYMFAPLVNSRLLSDLGSPMIRSFSSTRIRMREPIVINNKKLLKSVADYLKSDSYMYSSLCVPRATSSPPKEHIRYFKRVTTECSRSVLTMTDNQPALEAENRIEKDHAVDSRLPETSISGSETLAQALKNTIYANCRSLSVTGKWTHDSSLRKLVID